MWEHFLFKGWEVKFKHGLFVSDLYKIVIGSNFYQDPLFSSQMHPCTYQNSTAIIVDGFGGLSSLFARSLLSSSLSCQFTASHLIFAPLCTSGLIKCSCKKNLSCLDVIIDPEPAPSCGQETSRQIVLCH